MTDSKTEYKYRVFLSYSHADERWARWLHRALERYRPPKSLANQVPCSNGRPDRIAPVFRDRDELPSASSLSSVVNHALGDSECLVVICSPQAVRSRWISQEIETFRRLGHSKRILCFIVDGEPNSGDERECFPEALRFEWSPQTGLSSTPAEPAAADARANGDGKTLAKLKLIAGILGVGIDSLRQRDLQRRHRRLLAVTAGSLGIALITITLAVMAYLSNAEAQRNQDRAENLVGFMLGDLQDGLAEIGRLDMFMSVGTKAMEYFSSLENEDVDDGVLNQRAMALQRIGDAYLDQGEIETALQAFLESRSISEQLVSHQASNSEWQISLANSHFYVGLVHWQRGELESARAEFEKALPLVDDVSAREPKNTEWLLERSYAYTNYGRVLELQGNLEQALAVYTEIFEITSQLLQLEPNNIDYKVEVGFAHNNIGKLIQSLGRLEEAEYHFNKDLEIKIAVSASKPNQNEWQAYLATSYVHKARIQTVRGDLTAASLSYESAIAIFHYLLEVDPDQPESSLRLASYERELSALERRQGDLPSARDRLQRSAQIIERLLQIDASQAQWLSGMGLTQIETARLKILQQEYEESISLGSDAKATFSELLQRDPSNLETRKHLVVSRLVLGDAYAAAGNSELAENEWSTALHDMQADTPALQSLEFLEINAALLIRLDRTNEASLIQEKLLASGFQSQYF